MQRKIMIENILNSKVKIKIAKLFAERKQAFHVSDVARYCKISKSRASECLRELSEKGILESRVVGRSLVYNLSSNYLANLVSKLLTQDETLLSEIEKSFVYEAKITKPISIALFGSVVLKGLRSGSDVDFLVIASDRKSREKFNEISSDLTVKFGVNISVMLMSLEEFRRKSKWGEEFVINVLANHKTLYGKELEKLIWSEK